MPVLATLRFAYECPLAWENLTGGDRRRFCAQCEQHVTDLSAMTRAEASTLLAQATAPMCVRVTRDAAGNTVHASMPTLPSMPSVVRAFPRAALAAAAITAAGCAQVDDSAAMEDSGVADTAIVPTLVRGWNGAEARRKHEDEARQLAEQTRRKALDDARMSNAGAATDAAGNDGVIDALFSLVNRPPKVDPDLHMFMGVVVMTPDDSQVTTTVK